MGKSIFSSMYGKSFNTSLSNVRTMDNSKNSQFDLNNESQKKFTAGLNSNSKNNLISNLMRSISMGNTDPNFNNSNNNNMNNNMNNNSNNNLNKEK